MLRKDLLPTLIWMLAVVLSPAGCCYSQADVFEGEMKFIITSDLVYDTVTYLVKNEKVYKFQPASVSNLTGGYSRESTEVTDSSFISVVFNPVTGDSLVDEIASWKNSGASTPLVDTIVDGLVLSGNKYSVNVRGFYPEDSINNKTHVYYLEGEYRFRNGRSTDENDAFNTPRFEIPYLVIRELKDELDKTRGNELQLYSAKQMSLNWSMIRERWYSVEGF